MPEDLSHRTAIFYDVAGDYCHVAEAIAPEYGRLLYFVPWEGAFSMATGLIPGIGLDNIERCTDFFQHLDEADIAIFADVGNYGLQSWLRRQGMPVFGCGEGGKYETDRLLLKQMCAEVGIQTAVAVPVRGVTALREILEEHDNLYVKISYLRGTFESFKHRSWLHTKDKFNRIAADLGPYAEFADFLIEVPIEDDGDDACVEIGFDSYCADGKFPEVMLYGYESKDSGFVGRVGRLPSRMAAVRDALGTALERVDYRGPLSTETRESVSGSYLIDLTCRFPSPPSELQSRLVGNLGSVIWDVAHGRVPTPEYRYRFGAQIVLKSTTFAEHPIPLEIDQPDLVAIHGHCIVDGQDYAVSVSEIEELGGAIGMGDTLEEAIREAYEVAEGVVGDGVKYDSGVLQKALECVAQGEQLGLTFTALEDDYAASTTKAA